MEEGCSFPRRPALVIRVTVLLGLVLSALVASRLEAWPPVSVAKSADGLPRMAVSADSQLALLLKVLTADRNSPAPRGAPLSLGIVFEADVPASRRAKDGMADAIRRWNSFRGNTAVLLVSIDVGSSGALASLDAVGRPRALWVAPLRDLPVQRISAVSRARKILTVTGVPSYVEAGLAVGFEARQGGTRVVVNRGASIAEGADFSSKLLSLARIVNERAGSGR